MVDVFAVALVSSGEDYSSDMFAGWTREKADNGRIEKMIRSTAIRLGECRGEIRTF